MALKLVNFMRPEIAIVGAGILGVMTALACARKGAAVAIYDTEDIPNKRNLSFADARMWRHVHQNNPALEALAASSLEAWLRLQSLSKFEAVRKTQIVRLLTSAQCEVLGDAYDNSGNTFEILSADQLSIKKAYDIDITSEQRLFVANDALLINGKLIYSYLVDTLKSMSKVSFFPNTKINVDADISECSIQTAHGKRNYSGIILLTGRPGKYAFSQREPCTLKKHYQLHIDFNLSEATTNDGLLPLLNFGDPQTTWAVPSVDRKILSVSASNLFLTKKISVDQINEMTDYLIRKIKAEYTTFDVRVSEYFELPVSARHTNTYWEIRPDHNVISINACDASLFKAAPAISEIISDMIIKAR
ncbi:FAD-dependent oxidoreductase [Pseudomonas huanghezhanensis]|uniref:FAD-dependent oxidoreductase n=1 Tax=Pseudomonas huanghezhanensis TaxID=3002903 RepID=UPI0022860AA3|nr:FAD-dependent oxidoreductase [Pseudomonas sp. BSw22131]